MWNAYENYNIAPGGLQKNRWQN